MKDSINEGINMLRMHQPPHCITLAIMNTAEIGRQCEQIASRGDRRLRAEEGAASPLGEYQF